VAAPLVLAHKAAWVLTTLLAACGARAEVLFDPAPDRYATCVLAYAAEPVPGVPTVPLSSEALDLVAERRPLPRGAFTALQVAGRTLPGAFLVEPGLPSFAVPFDLIASAFVLLAAWDEATSAERDAHGRFPYAASLFAAHPVLELGRPPVDEYLAVVRDVVGARLAELGHVPLDPPDWGEGERFALALTHDVDNVKRWTARGWLGAGKRTAAAVRSRELDRARFELGGVGYALTRDLPRGEDPYWTFPELLRREDELGTSSTFYLIASHGHPTDGVQPAVYRRRTPALLHLLRQARREIGLHGNHRDARDLEALTTDRAALAERAQATVAGVRFHYLKCLYHETLPMLDEAGFDYDTSLAYAEREGWRCGFSFPFHPYDLARDRPLELVELPLALMDSTLQERRYRGLDAPQARAAATAVVERLRASGGGSAVLWHQNRFHPHVGRGYGDVYWHLLGWAREQGAALLPAGELVRRWKARAGENEL
jgi:hypothetical protein